MSDYRRKEVDVLIDIMMEHTSQMMRMMSDGIFNGEDFTHSRNTVLAIQTEIKRREMGFSPADFSSYTSFPRVRNNPAENVD